MGEDRKYYLKVNKKTVEEKLKDFVESSGTVCKAVYMALSGDTDWSCTYTLSPGLT